jgi:hypothetical protein
MDYGISSRAYLQRALELLDQDTEEALFHAAFELRCGIEARMEEYLEAWKEITNKKKHGWQIQALAKDIESAFRTGDQVVRLAVHRELKGDCLICFYYTPVREPLRKAGEKFGNYMHSKKQFHAQGHDWWLKLRKELEAAAADLIEANTGTLLGPPLHKRSTGEGSLKIELPEGASEVSMDMAMETAVQRAVKVEYLPNLPEQLEAVAHYWRPRANKAPTSPRF